MKFMKAKDKNKMNMNESKVYEFRVTGMTCTHCRSFVEKSIKLVSGVETVKVDLASGIAEVTGSAEMTARWPPDGFSGELSLFMEWI